MAALATTLRLYGRVQDSALGELIASIAWSLPAPVMLLATQTLVAGSAATVSIVGVSPSICIIVPPVLATEVCTLKGNAADVGVALDPNEATVLRLALGTTSFVLALAAGTNRAYTFIWL